jgi:hypothetical protein
MFSIPVVMIFFLHPSSLRPLIPRCSLTIVEPLADLLLLSRAGWPPDCIFQQSATLTRKPFFHLSTATRLESTPSLSLFWPFVSLSISLRPGSLVPSRVTEECHGDNGFSNLALYIPPFARDSRSYLVLLQCGSFSLAS